MYQNDKIDDLKVFKHIAIEGIMIKVMRVH